MLRKGNDHPYIIAVGASMREISIYYIEVEKHLIPVSDNTRSVILMQLFH